MTKNKIIRLIFTIVFLLIPLQLMIAQTKGKIKGSVVDGANGEGLPGVNILVKGTY